MLLVRYRSRLSRRPSGFFRGAVTVRVHVAAAVALRSHGPVRVHVAAAIGKETQDQVPELSGDPGDFSGRQAGRRFGGRGLALGQCDQMARLGLCGRTAVRLERRVLYRRDHD